VTRGATLLLAAALLCGCATQWRYHLGAPLIPLDAPPATGTPLADVLQALGPPLRISAGPTGYIMAWERWRVREDAVGFSLGAVGADFLNIDWGLLRADGEFLLLSFDRDHRMASATSSRWDTRKGGGQALQPLASFIDVVEPAGLIEGLRTHHWGATLLGELPVGLNRNSSPDSGASGIEQRGTPSGIGQRALEMR